MRPRVIFNGQEYSSPEAMPAAVRQAYEQAMGQLADADRNGIQQTSITVNGQTYASVDEMPPAARRLYEAAMAQVDANRDGIPGDLEARVAAQGQPAPTIRELTWTRSGQLPIARTMFSGTRWFGSLRFVLVLIGLVALLLWWVRS